ncbi:unnamed protein product [Prorocentrum cordatum]|uniref:Uncharacterized protein n=1 Tax=Prorocentrum cordatum TaxID=2364126 RepID=A0ABN9PMF5_9DINO|nr:unnamed protein product [Polarella glacialis]
MGYGTTYIVVEIPVDHGNAAYADYDCDQFALCDQHDHQHVGNESHHLSYEGHLQIYEDHVSMYERHHQTTGARSTTTWQPAALPGFVGANCVAGSRALYTARAVAGQTAPYGAVGPAVPRQGAAQGTDDDEEGGDDEEEDKWGQGPGRGKDEEQDGDGAAARLRGRSALRRRPRGRGGGGHPPGETGGGLPAEGGGKQRELRLTGPPRVQGNTDYFSIDVMDVCRGEVYDVACTKFYPWLDSRLRSAAPRAAAAGLGQARLFGGASVARSGHGPVDAMRGSRDGWQIPEKLVSSTGEPLARDGPRGAEIIRSEWPRREESIERAYRAHVDAADAADYVDELFDFANQATHEHHSSAPQEQDKAATGHGKPQVLMGAHAAPMASPEHGAQPSDLIECLRTSDRDEIPTDLRLDDRALANAAQPRPQDTDATAAPSDSADDGDSDDRPALGQTEPGQSPDPVALRKEALEAQRAAMVEEQLRKHQSNGSAKLFALCLVAPLALAPWARAQGPTPVEKVIELMEGTPGRGKEDKKAEQVGYAAFKQFCDDTETETSRNIAEAEMKIEVLKADIEKYKAEAARLKEEADLLDGDIAAWTGDDKAATKVRDMEKAAYDELHQDYSESVSALQRAIEVLKAKAHDLPQADLAQVSALRRGG